VTKEITKNELMLQQQTNWILVFQEYPQHRISANTKVNQLPEGYPYGHTQGGCYAGHLFPFFSLAKKKKINP